MSGSISSVRMHAALAAAAAVVLAGCGGGGGSTGGGPAPQIREPSLALAVAMKMDGPGTSAELTLSWAEVPEADRYLVFRDNAQVRELTATVYVESRCSGIYSYRVEARRQATVLLRSKETDVSFRLPRLSPPAGLATQLTGSGSVSSMQLSWQAAGGAPGYLVFRDNTKIADVAGTAYTDAAIGAGTYSYHVVAHCGSVQSAQSPTITATVRVLDSPAYLAARVAGHGAAGDVLLAWDAVAGATNYQVLRNGAHMAVTPATEYTDADLGPGTYRYQVFAQSDTGRSAASAERLAIVPDAAIAPDPTVALTHVDLPAPNPPDGADYETEEYLHSGGWTITLRNGDERVARTLEMIGAHKAYQRGYFGQGVTVAVVDDGFDLAHPELSLNILQGIYRTRDPALPFPRELRHGSQVAGVVAGVRDGSGFHGVAPEAKVVAYYFADEHAAFQHAVDNGIPIVNNSWLYATRVLGSIEQAGATVSIILSFPVDHKLAQHPGCVGCVQDLQDLELIKDIVADEDIVLVWGAGNEGRNSDSDYGFMEGCIGNPHFYFEDLLIRTDDCTYYSTQDILDDFTILPLETGPFLRHFDATIRLATLGLDPNAMGLPAAGPIFHPELLGRWVAVSGVTPDKRIYYNGCGQAKHFCMVAPAYTRTFNEQGVDGTSFAAPLVSGALAVLKSRLPDMPMYAVLAILFHTAEDLGDPGTDEVFGRGLLDLDAATSVQGSVAIVLDEPGTKRTARAKLTGSKLRLSPALRGLKQQAADISVAVNFLDSYYYSMPLAGLLRDPAGGRPELGGAAADMLSSASEVQLGAGFAAQANAGTGELSYIAHAGRSWRLEYEHCRDCADSTWREYRSARIAAPFFAAGGQAALGEYRIGHGWSAFGAIGYREQLDDERYRQAGLRWQSAPAAGRKWSGMLEFSRSVEDDALYGAKFEGALAVGDSATHQLRVGGELALDDSWLLAVSATAGRTESEARAGSMIAGISGLRFAGWRTYVEGRSLLRTNDALRIGLARQTQVAGGSMVLRHAVVDGEAAFSEEHYMKLNSEYSYRTSSIDLAQDSDLIAQIGYSFGLGADMRAALGLESAGGGGQGSDFAASFELRWDL